MKPVNKFAVLFYRLAPSEREALADKLGTSVAYLRHIAYRRKQISLGLADALVAALGNGLVVEDLPLAPDARRHHEIRLEAV